MYYNKKHKYYCFYVYSSIIFLAINITTINLITSMSTITNMELLS